MSGLFMFYILLFALGCGGAVSMGLLHRCLKEDLTGDLLLVFGALLLSLSRTLIHVYAMSLGRPLQMPELLSGFIGLSIGGFLYWFLFRSLSRLKHMSFKAAFYPTLFIFILQLVRTVIYFAGNPELTEHFYSPVIVTISAYLFYVGLSFRRGIRDEWNPALQLLLKRLGNITLVFAPLSTAFYLIIHTLDLNNPVSISLDFIYLTLWSFTSLTVVLQYLARLGTIPSRDEAGTTFISRYGLTPRETEVLNLILLGLTNKQIGESLFISFTTARTHVSHILEKTGAKNRVELVSLVNRSSK